MWLAAGHAADARARKARNLLLYTRHPIIILKRSSSGYFLNSRSESEADTRSVGR